MAEVEPGGRFSATARVGAWGALAALLAALSLAYAAAIVDIPFFTKGEPREALVVQSIHDDGRWVLPLRNGNEIPSKPPLFHWLGALTATAWGSVSETAVRLPSSAAALLIVALTAIYGFSAYGPLGGILAAVILATSQQWLVSATTARVDMVLAAAISIALLAFARDCLRGPPRLSLVFYGACAAAVLAKGPVGLVLPLAVAGSYLLARGEARALLRSNFRAVAILLSLPLLWYALAYAQGGQAFFDKLILKENVFRVLNPQAVDAGHVRPFYAYLPLLLGGFAPWSFFVPAVLIDLARRRGRLDRDRVLLPLLWFGVTFVLFSVAGSKRSVYLIPAYPALALLCGQWWARIIDGSSEPGPSFSSVIKWASWLLAAVMLVAFALLALEASGLSAIEVLAPLMSPGDQANLSVVAKAAHQNSAAIFVALIVATTATGGLALAAARARWAALASCIATVVATLSILSATVFLPQLARAQSLKGFMSEITAQVPAHAALSFFRGFDYGAVFYHGRPIARLDSLDSLHNLEDSWILVWEPAFETLREQAAGLTGDGRQTYHALVANRHDYGGNPRKDALLLVRLQSGASDAQPPRD